MGNRFLNEGLIKEELTPLSYVDEIGVRYLMKKGYVVSQGIWFQIPRKKTGKKVSSWSDIDILAVKSTEPPLVVQCKSFIGTREAKESARRIIEWFDNAIYFLKNDQNHSKWLVGKVPKKVLLVDFTVKKAEELLKKHNIEIWHYKEILIGLLKELENDVKKREKGRIGMEEDVLLRILSDMIRRGIIKVA